MPKQYFAGGGGAEWSHVVDIDKLSSEPRTFTFSADERQRIDLARRLAIVSIEEAKAVVTLQKIGGGIVHALGTVRAELTQACVVSLAPVPVHIEDEFEGWYGDKTATAVSFAKARSEREVKKGHTEIEVMEESADPEPIIGGKIDIGELATQYLSLALDPYPRAEGVSPVYSIGPSDKDGEGAELRKSPFEALKDWKEKR
jgi:hypothetical protein